MPSQFNQDASKAILTVVRETIGDHSIDLDDDFYMAGGHSLLIIRIVRRLQTEFGIKLSIRQFAVNSQIGALVDACSPVGD